MQDTYMDRNYFGNIHLSSFWRICADLEDVQERKQDRKRLLDRTRVSEYQTLHGGLNQESRNPPGFTPYTILLELL